MPHDGVEGQRGHDEVVGPTGERRSVGGHGHLQRLGVARELPHLLVGDGKQVRVFVQQHELHLRIRIEHSRGRIAGAARKVADGGAGRQGRKGHGQLLEHRDGLRKPPLKMDVVPAAVVPVPPLTAQIVSPIRQVTHKRKGVRSKQSEAYTGTRGGLADRRSPLAALFMNALVVDVAHVAPEDGHFFEHVGLDVDVVVLRITGLQAEAFVVVVHAF